MAIARNARQNRGNRSLDAFFDRLVGVTGNLSQILEPLRLDGMASPAIACTGRIDLQWLYRSATSMQSPDRSVRSSCRDSSLAEPGIVQDWLSAVRRPVTGAPSGWANTGTPGVHYKPIRAGSGTASASWTWPTSTTSGASVMAPPANALPTASRLEDRVFPFQVTGSRRLSGSSSPQG